MLAPCGRNTPDSTRHELVPFKAYPCYKIRALRGLGLGVRGSHPGEENIRVNESMASEVLFERRTCLLI